MNRFPTRLWKPSCARGRGEMSCTLMVLRSGVRTQDRLCRRREGRPFNLKLRRWESPRDARPLDHEHGRLLPVGSLRSGQRRDARVWPADRGCGRFRNPRAIAGSRRSVAAGGRSSIRTARAPCKRASLPRTGCPWRCWWWRRPAARMARKPWRRPLGSSTNAILATSTTLRTAHG